MLFKLLYDVDDQDSEICKSALQFGNKLKVYLIVLTQNISIELKILKNVQRSITLKKYIESFIKFQKNLGISCFLQSKEKNFF